MRALPVVTLVVALLPMAVPVVRRAWRALPRRVADVPPPADAAVIDIAPYLARREIVEGAIAIAALARHEAIARHSERDRRSLRARLVVHGAPGNALTAHLRGTSAADESPRRSGITVAHLSPVARSATIEHLA